MDQYLRERGIEEPVVQKLKDDRIDASVITLMSDDQLKTYFPRYGDRIGVVAFANKQRQTIATSPNKKRSLREKLIAKLQNKQNCSEEHVKRSVSQTGNSNAKKMTRKIELGWLHTYGNGLLKQVRSPSGGGTRNVEVPLDCIVGDILPTAKELFFPNGISKKGSVSDFFFYIADPTHMKLSLELSFRELCENTKLKHLRIYMVTCLSGMSLDDHFNEELGISHDMHERKEEDTECTRQIETASNESLPSIDMSEPSEMLIQIEGSGTRMDATAVFDHFDPVPSSTAYQQIGSESFYTNDSERAAGNLSLENLANFEEGDNSSDLLFSTQFENNDQPDIIRLHRSMVLCELIQVFKEPAITSKPLQFIFIDEEGHDAQGVRRDVYSVFWKAFLLKYTDGEDFRVPILSNELGDCEWEAIGRVLVKGYKDNKYFPISIASAFLVAVVHGETAVTSELLKNSFMHFVSNTERDVIENAISGFEHDPEELIELYDRFGCRGLPEQESLLSTILQIAHRVFIQEPKYSLDALQRVGKKFWRKVFPTVEDVLSMYQNCEPTVQKVLGLFNTNPISKEENDAFKYLQRFVRGRNKDGLKLLLRFLTGSDMICVSKIEVSFVARHGVGRVPTAHTCGPALELPSTYVNYPDFRNEWENILQSKENMKMMIA